MTGGVALATGFLKSFADAGWTREGVDAVVCTHLHVDHVGWNTMLVDGAWVPTFPKARYLIGRAEYEHWRAEEGEARQTSYARHRAARSSTPAWSELVDIDHQIYDESSAWLRPRATHRDTSACAIRIRGRARP